MVLNRIHELRGDTPLWRIAQQADMPQSQLSRIANGSSRGPCVSTAMKIARALDCRLDDLFIESELDAA